MITARINNNIKFPNFVFVDDLEYIAERIFIPTMQRNIESQVALDESPLPALEPKTIEAKRRQGLSEKILIATGKLRSGFRFVSNKKNKVTVYLVSERSDIGEYLQIHGVGKKNKKFNFFGISTRMEESAVNHMKRKIRGQLVNAR